MTSEDRPINKKKLRDINRSSQEYIDYCAYFAKAMRRSRNSIYDVQHNVITDPALIRENGHLALCALREDYIFSNIAYRKVDIAKLAGVGRSTVTEWGNDNALSVPMFKASIYIVRNSDSTRNLKPYYRWFDVYLIEEVLVILKYLKKIYDRSYKLRKAQPEWFLMNEELENVRDEIKRRIRRNESAIWSYTD